LFPHCQPNEARHRDSLDVVSGAWVTLTLVGLVVCAAAMVAAQRRLVGAGTVAVAVAVTAGCAVMAWRDHTLQGHLAAAASELGDVAVEVQCPDPFFGEFLWTPGEGHVRIDADGRPDGVARLDGWVCNELARWPANHAEDRARTAVHVLAHEVAHLRGDLVEASAECWAAQHSELLGVALGADRGHARAAQDWYIAEVLPRMRGDYSDPERCRRGGEWDAGRDAFG
jgi:hypothetical protein